jgi:rod shape-determining protein MreC
MRRRVLAHRHWLILGVLLLGLWCLGEATGLRRQLVALISPAGRVAGGRPSPWSGERSQLLYENRRLREELERVGQLWRHERAAWSRVAGLPKEGDSEAVSGLLQQWQRQLGQLHRRVVAARLIYRDPLPWGSCFWIDAGADQVQHNSPVVIGNALVGVIDSVGRSCSRVRCITDSQLVVAVRVARGSPQTGALLHYLELLQQGLGQQKELTALREQLAQPKELAYLAKGEVTGSGLPLWQESGTLRGTGFNYDFADAFGPARPLSAHNLIEPGDLLVTSGLDGIFPPGLDVGWVTHLEPLREGAISLEAEVRACAPQLSHLETVFILPPTWDAADVR